MWILFITASRALIKYVYNIRARLIVNNGYNKIKEERRSVKAKAKVL
jgi:hypothetical protein